MTQFAKISAGVVVDMLLADQSFIDTRPDAADWVEAPIGVGLDWTYAGGVFTGPSGEPVPPPPSAIPKYILNGSEWVMRFTDAEWDWIGAQRKLTTSAGLQLNKMMDAIRWTNSVDVSAETMDPFYSWLLNNGIPGGQTRIDELRAAK